MTKTPSAVDPILMSVFARTFRSITDEMSASVVKAPMVLRVWFAG